MKNVYTMMHGQINIKISVCILRSHQPEDDHVSGRNVWVVTV